MANRTIVDLIKLMEEKRHYEETPSWDSLIALFKSWIA